jgi:hypothetical protein
MNGTQMYSELCISALPSRYTLSIEGAPECYRDEADRSSSRAIRKAAPNKDIWSMGCVFSEAAVWLVLNQDGLTEYRNERRAATDSIRGLLSTAWSGCFHDGEKKLPAVDEVHSRVRQGGRKNDTVTDDVVNIIEDMLESALKRQDAQWVYDRFFTRVLRYARATSLSPSSPSTKAPWPTAFDLPTDGSPPRQPPPELPPEFSLEGLGIRPSPIIQQSTDVVHNEQMNKTAVSRPSAQLLLSTENAKPRPISSPDSGYIIGPDRIKRNSGFGRSTPGDFSYGSPKAIGQARSVSGPPPKGSNSILIQDRPPKLNGRASLGDPFATSQSVESAAQAPKTTVHPTELHTTHTTIARTRGELPCASMDLYAAWIGKQRTKEARYFHPPRGHDELRALQGRDQVCMNLPFAVYHFAD